MKHFKPALLVVCLSAVMALTGCSDSLPSLPKVNDLNPFKEIEPPLPGKRIAVMPAQERIGGELADGSTPIVLPPSHLNDSWAQPGGDATNAPGHLELAGPVKQTWSADAGTGSSKSGRVSASPIVVAGRVYTLNAGGKLSAFSLSGGSPLWRASLDPSDAGNAKGGSFVGSLNPFASADGGADGGGIASDGTNIYGAGGTGVAIAFDAQSGKRVWEHALGVPVRTSPTAAGGRIFIVTVDGRLFCLSATDGSELWVVRGLPQQISLGINSSPAVDGDVVVVPYPSGDIIGIKVSDGSALWSENLARTRTTSQLASMSDAARPAIDNGTMFAVSHGGRMVATSIKTGERLWSLNIPSKQSPWVAGESIYVVDTSGQLMAVARRDGKIQWTAKLPEKMWSGPVLAGSTLWLVSSKGTLVGADPTTGRIVGQIALGTPVYIPPVVAQGKMFILTDSAKLVAFN